MTSSSPRDLSNADLLAYMETMREEIVAMKRLQQQQSETIDNLQRQGSGPSENVQRWHREEIAAQTASMHSKQTQIRELKAQAHGNGVVGVQPDLLKTPRHILPRWSFGGRGKRLGMGMSLAFLLLVAPSQSAVTHASFETPNNTSYGDSALPPGTVGIHNSAFGYKALSAITSGNDNTASGHYALANTTGGSGNSASGSSALYLNTTGDSNTASGTSALSANTTGGYNTAVGYQAGYTDYYTNANTTGSANTFIGANSGPGVPDQLTNATAIGANAVVSQSNSIVLGGTGPNTQKVGVGTETPHSALQIAKGFLQIRPITGSAPAAAQCATADDAGRLVVRTDGTINLYVCNGTTWIGK